MGTPCTRAQLVCGHAPVLYAADAPQDAIEGPALGHCKKGGDLDSTREALHTEVGQGAVSQKKQSRMLCVLPVYVVGPAGVLACDAPMTKGVSG